MSGIVAFVTFVAFLTDVTIIIQLSHKSVTKKNLEITQSSQRGKRNVTIIKATVGLARVFLFLKNPFFPLGDYPQSS